MPTYVYQCQACRKKVDAVRRIEERNDAPLCCGAATERRIVAPLAVRSFSAYQAIAVDKDSGARPLIRSKAEHEAFLRRNGYEEVGNDSSMAPLHTEQLAERRTRKLKELADDGIQPSFELDPDTHEAHMETT